MRLVDADALLKEYDLENAAKYGNKDAKQQRHSYDTMMMYEIADMIEDAPTAYDVDKVVEQLDSYYKEEDEKGCYIPERIRMKVEDIVKAGGVHE